MIISKKAEAVIHPSNFKYFKSLGYENLKCGDKLLVPIVHLTNGSHSIIRAKCDCKGCNSERDMMYKNYLRNIEKQGFYSCSKCFDIKSKKTNLEIHGNENYNNSEKNKITNMEKYGVENPQQNINFFNRQQMSALKMKKFENLHYQGSYELDFLEKYYKKVIIENGMTIRYNKNKIYFPDFFIPELNLIIEIKSEYTFKLHESKNLEKRKACIEQGYNFIFIINKNYEGFEKIIQK